MEKKSFNEDTRRLALTTPENIKKESMAIPIGVLT